MVKLSNSIYTKSSILEIIAYKAKDVLQIKELLAKRYFIFIERKTISNYLKNFIEDKQVELVYNLQDMREKYYKKVKEIKNENHERIK